MDENKIIHFPQQKGILDKFLATLLENKEQNNINNLVIGYTVRKNSPAGGRHDVKIYWFGEDSCYYVIGLLDDMRRKVHQWMDESNEMDVVS